MTERVIGKAAQPTAAKDDLDRTVSAERLKAIEGSSRLNSRALEDLATLMLEGRLSAAQAQGIVAGKPVAKQRLSRNPGYHVVGEDGLLEVVDRKGSSHGHLLYNTEERLDGRVLFVQEVVMDSGDQKNGYGHKLLRHIEKVAGREGAHAVLLEVDRHNPGALSFFESLGYQEIAVNNADNADRIILRKGL